MPLYFNSVQVPMAAKAFYDAEKLVLRQFRLADQELKNTKYEVKTLAYLDEHEIKDGTFAHLCKYCYEQAGESIFNSESRFDFYRVCLQDNTILDAIERANPFVKLRPLMLYIAVHELIHILRFSSGQSDFNAGEDEKEKEEMIVHRLTRSTLEPVKGEYDLEIILDCFDSNLRKFDLFH